MSDEVEDLLRQVRAGRGDPEPAPAAKPAPPAAAAATATAAAIPEHGLLARLFAWREASILSHRELDLKLGDPGGTLLLLGQAPIIALLVGVAFRGVEQDRTIDFVLAMVATWFGCFNASRELVKERAIFLRERRTGLPVRGYLLAKLGVLLLLCAVQCLVLVAIVGFHVTWRGSPPLVFISAFLTAAAAGTLGLVISAASPTQTVAMAVVPIALIPQLIFSEAVLGKDAMGMAGRIQDAMIASWGYWLLEELRRSEPVWGSVVQAGLVLSATGVGLLLVAGLFLHLQEQD